MNLISLNRIALTNIRAMCGSTRESIQNLSDATSIALSTLKRRMAGLSSFTLDEIELISNHWDLASTDLLSQDFRVVEALAARKQD